MSHPRYRRDSSGVNLTARLYRGVSQPINLGIFNDMQDKDMVVGRITGFNNFLGKRGEISKFLDKHWMALTLLYLVKRGRSINKI